MKCFSCKCELKEKCSQYGYYYQCPKCGKILETPGQSNYNAEKFRNRKDNKK